MFELSVARKYLIPKRKQLSVALISLMSVGVITLVVWLVLVFLSVTEGIERGWLEKVTSLNAPLKINPTPAYFSSYYYQVDSISQDSQYTYKTIAEKLQSEKTDPYSAEFDTEIPISWKDPDRNSDGFLKDPVKIASSILENLKIEVPELTFQDYELSGALMRLQLIRPESSIITAKGDESQGFITQVSYLSSFSDKSPYLSSLMVQPTVSDLNHLFYMASYAQEGSYDDKPGMIKGASYEDVSARLKTLLENTVIKELKTSLNYWKIPLTLLPEGKTFAAVEYYKNGKINHLILPKEKDNDPSLGTLKKEGQSLIFTNRAGKHFTLPASTPLIVENELRFKAQILPATSNYPMHLKEIYFAVKGELQGHPLSGQIPWEGLEISDAVIKDEFDKSPQPPPPWSYKLKQNSDKYRYVLSGIGENKKGVLLAKSFQENGVRIGDRGYLSYPSPTASSVQEQRQPIYVAGFYDPGVMSIGNKCILVPQDIAHAINGASNTFSLDKTISNGIQVWFKDFKQADAIKEKLSAAFVAAGIDNYWKVQTYKEYDFAKDLIQQFQSDKYLFTLIGIIILIVACCNIISLLVLLVNDKKREIGVLQSMGASAYSIAGIFGLCGILMGIISSVIGTLAAIFTLQHIDILVKILSFLQGHDAFNTVFYGKSLPNQLSHEALTFVLIATPLISLIAGLVPAIKACRLRPSAILRSE